MQIWNCIVPSEDLARVIEVGNGVPENAYVRVYAMYINSTYGVELSTESYDAVVADGIDVIKEGPVNNK